MIFLNRSDMIVKEKYKQLFICHHFGGVKTMGSSAECVGKFQELEA